MKKLLPLETKEEQINMFNNIISKIEEIIEIERISIDDEMKKSIHEEIQTRDVLSLTDSAHFLTTEIYNDDNRKRERIVCLLIF